MPAREEVVPLALNEKLPAVSPLNVLKARSTIAAVLSLAAIVGPLLGGGLGEILTELAANADLVQAQTERVVDAFNVLVGVGGLVWFWLERRSPRFRLSFKAH